MPNYFRSRVGGGVYFFTVVTYRRRPIFRTNRARVLLRESMDRIGRLRAWETVAFVLLPDHFHAIWRLPDGDSDYSWRMGRVKKLFTEGYLAGGGRRGKVTSGEAAKGYAGIWQPRFWEHTIRNARDFKMHLDYIHLNPVKHGLAQRPRDWAWSSFQRYVALGEYEIDWCGRADLPGEVEYFYAD